MVKLENIADVQTGLVLTRKRASANDSSPKTYRLLTLKSFDSSGWLNKTALDSFSSNSELESRYLTNRKDVIIRLTSPYTALAIDSDSEGIVIPSNFAIIRLRKDSLLPEFVALLLNSNPVEKKFHQSAISTTIPLIKTSYLRNIEFAEKSKEIQEKIVGLNKLQQREKILLSDLQTEKGKLAQAYIGKVIMEE